MEAGIAKEQGKRVERTAGYYNDEDAFGRSLVVIQSWVSWRLLAASWIQEEDMVGRSRGKNMGPIREHWLVQSSSNPWGGGIAY